MDRSPKLLLHKGASILFIFLLLVTACAQPEKALDPRFQGIDAEIESLISEYHAVGLAVAIVENGEIIYKDGFGYRDYENRLPVDEYTVFGIGSCTKAFTATILGILEDKGRLKLSDKPSKFLPSLKFYNAEMDENIQIGDLLSHSVGVSGRGFDTSSCLFLSDKNSSVEKIKYFKPISELREQFNYNNTFYGFAGLIGESITDQTWSQNLSQYIFEPLEMKHSYAGFQSASQESNFSLGYAVDQSNAPVKVQPEEIPAKASAGEIFSSLMDMTKWVQAWLNKGMYKAQQIIPPQYILEATSPKQKISANMDYGYGWIMQQLYGHQTVEHSGAISGYTSNIVMFPEEKIGIVILTNQSISNISNRITDNIVRRIFDVDTEPTSQHIRFERTPALPIAGANTVINLESKPSHPLEEFEGKYFNPAYGQIHINYTDSTLYADFPYTKLRLQHREANTFIDFFTEEIPLFMGNYMNFNFQINSSDKIDGFLLNLDNEPVLFRKNNE